MFRYIIVFYFLFNYCSSNNIPTQIDLGVESIAKNKNGTFDINVYMLNEVQLAGFQLDLLPKGIFEIISISGGRGEAAGFNMSAGKKGTMLGFSFTGAVIESSKTNVLSENLLFTINVKSINDLPQDPVNIGFTVIMAGRSGEKIETNMIEYLYDFTPQKR